jgi:hypothetical protein
LLFFLLCLYLDIFQLLFHLQRWSFEQVRLYDISAQRRPVLSIDFRETPIKALAEDIDGNTIYLGNGTGDMASVDIRTGTP